MKRIEPGHETSFVGLPISKGIALARVCLFNDDRHNGLFGYKVSGEEALQREKERVTEAIKTASERIDVLIKEVSQKVGSFEAKIFEAQKMILNDKLIAVQIKEDISTFNHNAEIAVLKIFDYHEARLLKVENEYIRERASDIIEVRKRVLDALVNLNPTLKCEGQKHCQRGGERVVVAEELSPALTVDLDASRILGFVTERGGPTSHAAILARSLGIPAVSGIKGIHSMVGCGSEVLINGNTGEVYVWPTQETIEEVTKTEPLRTPKIARVVEHIEGLSVMANISLSSNARLAITMKADGIGLYRTEFEFFSANKLLSEDEQYACYKSVVEQMQGKPVYFRLLDIGGDKNAPFFKLPQEENPYLGFRGTRLLLNRKDLLTAQARALARSSVHGNVHILYPMIVDIDQYHQIRSAFDEAVSGLPTGEMKHGVMFEVPSACLQADALLSEADFASIGTNDLIQYLFAVDRNNEFVAYDYKADKPAFWMLLAQITDAAKKHNRPLSVCGESANNTSFLQRFLNLGIKTLSVSPRFIPELRLAAQQPETVKTMARV